MKTPFICMNGLGNIFFIVNDLAGELQSQYPAIMSETADKQYDQMLFVTRAKKADFFFHIYNADGSEATQCLNGARCVARWAREEGFINRDEFVLENASGFIPVNVKDFNHIELTLPLPILKGLYRDDFYLVDVGNLHLIKRCDDVYDVDVDRVGKEMQQEFPLGINVSFYSLISPTEITLRTYERGVGETAACGSAALATVFLGITQKILEDCVIVRFKTGTLEIKKKNNILLLIGPAHY